MISSQSKSDACLSNYSTKLIADATILISYIYSSLPPPGHRVVAAATKIAIVCVISQPVSTSKPGTAPLNTHELAAWRGMLEAHARVMRQLDAQMHAEHGLSVSAYEVLMFLADAPENRMRMSDIAKSVLLSRSGCSRLVGRLADLGYVTRSADAADGRGMYAELTDAGRKKIEAARATHLEGVRRFFLDHLTTTDQIALGDIWTRFHADAGLA
jgi:DNA-binding MarR family transcriptional regulator